MFTFRQGTKLILDDGANRYSLLVSSASASQTFLESIQNTKTIHNPVIVERAFTTEKGVANLTFNCHLGNSQVEASLLNWLGFGDVGGEHKIVTNNNSINKVTIYIDAGNTLYKLENCVAQNISFSLSRKEILSAEITAVAPDLVEVSSMPTTGNLVEQPISFTTGTILIGGFPRIAGVTCEVTRSIEWLSQKSIFDIGSIYKVKTPVLTSMAISGTITQNKTDSTNTNAIGPVVIELGDSFKINLPSCNLVDRWDMGTIHKRITDYKLLPASVNSFIKF